MDLMPWRVTYPLEELPSDFLKHYQLVLLRQERGEVVTCPEIHAILEARERQTITPGNIWRWITRVR